MIFTQLCYRPASSSTRLLQQVSGFTRMTHILVALIVTWDVKPADIEIKIVHLYMSVIKSHCSRVSLYVAVDISVSHSGDHTGSHGECLFQEKLSRVCQHSADSIKAASRNEGEDTGRESRCSPSITLLYFYLSYCGFADRATAWRAINLYKPVSCQNHLCKMMQLKEKKRQMIQLRGLNLGLLRLLIRIVDF